LFLFIQERIKGSNTLYGHCIYPTVLNFHAAKSLVTATQNLVVAVETSPEPQLLATDDGRTTAHRTGNAMERASTGEEGEKRSGLT
jgi:hypothetical protein